jgi:hypothetical protein
VTNGYKWTYIFSAVCPATGEDFTLVLPAVNAKVMDLFLAHFAATLPEEVHAVMVFDGAGWHDPRALNPPENLTLVLLPPYSPELNPVERVWLYLRERYLSLRVLDDTEAVIEACCTAWNALAAEPGRLHTLCAYPWITKISS